MIDETLNIAVACTNSLDDVDYNLELIEKLSQEAASGRANIIFFPENVLFMRVKEGTEVPFFSESDSALEKIKLLAKKNNIYIHLGSIPFKQQDKIFNSTILITPNAELRVLYSKVHLFDIQLKGQAPIRESDVFARGNLATIFKLGSWSFGSSICYDIRFSEMYLKYAEVGVDVVLIPAAFLKTTGEAHWHVLNRARAIESQSYVVSSAQGGLHNSIKYPGVQRETFGHALVVDPWGAVQVDNNTPNSVQIFQLSKNKIFAVREQIPMADHRKNSPLSLTTSEVKL